MAVVHRHDRPRPLGMDALQASVANIGDLTGIVLVVAPPESRPAAGTAGPFPLSLGWQRVLPRGGRFAGARDDVAQPFTKRQGVGVADVHHRMLIALLVGARIAWLAPACAGTMLP